MKAKHVLFVGPRYGSHGQKVADSTHRRNSYAPAESMIDKMDQGRVNARWEQVVNLYSGLQRPAEALPASCYHAQCFVQGIAATLEHSFFKVG